MLADGFATNLLVTGAFLLPLAAHLQITRTSAMSTSPPSPTPRARGRTELLAIAGVTVDVVAGGAVIPLQEMKLSTPPLPPASRHL